MRNPIVVLNSLASNAADNNYTYKRLYRNLYNIEFYLDAYAQISPNIGSKTKGINEGTIDGVSLKRINTLVEKLRNQSFQPTPARRTDTPKKNGKLRPLGLPTFEDKLVQEVVRRILESIYEAQFSVDSHAFRPKKSCHTALKQIKNTFTGTRWFIKGKIEGFFDNIGHHTLINIIRRKIKDEKFINLIWKFLRAGYVEDWVFQNSLSETAQGGIISPILSNIYLNELDQYIEEYTAKFNKGDKRKYKELCDSNYRRMKYVRYADDFLIGVIASKEEVVNIKQDLTVFLADKLNLELNAKKTLITHSKKNARVLGYDIRVTRDWQIRKMPNGTKKRKYNFQAKLFVPREKYIKKLIDLGALSLGKNNQWKPIHRPYLIHSDDLEIIMQYNAEIRGLYNYYRLASNVHVLQSFRHTMKYSMIKTYAHKYKSTVSKIISKFSINGDFGIRYKTKRGQHSAYFID